MRLSLCCVLAGVLAANLAGSLVSAQVHSRAPAEDSLLGAARLAVLPPAEREAWLRYLAASRTERERDRAVMAAELKAAGLKTWVPAPAGTGFTVSKEMTGGWLGTETAKQLADILISYQTPSGGWSKRTDFEHVRRAGESYGSEHEWIWIGTLDNDATTAQLELLGAVALAQEKHAHRESFLRGIDYLLRSQMPVGCWPQVYPLEGGYHDAITYNDDASVNALELLRAVSQGEYAFVTAALRQRAQAAVQRGITCILATQVTVAGKKTVWCAQHDPLTLQPIKARTYEHASLSGKESVALVDLLMRIDTPSPEVIAAVHGAAAWFRTSALYGYSYTPRGLLTAKANGGPLWARFYELNTNRPIFSDRDGIIRYDMREIGEERRTGYLWYTDQPAGMLRRYDQWARLHPRSSS